MNAISRPRRSLAGERVLITGAAGSIGAAIADALREADVMTFETDIDALDVRDSDAVDRWLRVIKPTLVLHLAGAKHAPEGELDPAATFETNVRGTANVLAAARGARVVTASTCKACDPETVYGATKLIAERMTLNAGGSVARFYNVRESSGNVFSIWESLQADEPLPVAPCSRYFISLEDAVALVLWASVLEPARYVIDPGPARRMDDVAAERYPGRPQRPIAPRRGDRLDEPFHARSEAAIATDVDRVIRIASPHDPVA